MKIPTSVDQKSDIKVQVEFYANEIVEKRLDFSILRKLLDQQGQDPDDIQYILKRVDKRSIRLEEVKAIRSKGKSLWIGGAICVGLGVVLMLIFFFKTGGNLYFITLGLVGIGLATMMYGRNDMNRY